MKTKQPIWKLVANLGDVNPIEYGGLFVFSDETGVYPPEAEMLTAPENMGLGESEVDKWEVHRFILEPCTFVNGILSDNPFHPDRPVWFADKLANLASTWGRDVDSLIALFISSDPLKRAEAWEMVGTYFGFYNLDSYPLSLTREQTEARYSTHPYTSKPNRQVNLP